MIPLELAVLLVLFALGLGAMIAVIALAVAGATATEEDPLGRLPPTWRSQADPPLPIAGCGACRVATEAGDATLRRHLQTGHQQ